MRNLAIDVADRGVIIGLLSPGTVLNDAMREQMRKRNLYFPTVDVKESVGALMGVIDAFTPDQNGAFIRYTGEQVPW